MIKRKLTDTYESWFWQGVDRKDDQSLCWNWQRARSKGRDGKNNRYGMYRFKGPQRYSHRVAYELTHGPIPLGQVVCHRCDNPGCCNPGHLFLGTQKDNCADAGTKGTMARDRTARRVLDEEQVRAIRASINSTNGELGRLFNVNPTTIRQVRERVTYKEVT